MTKFIGRVAAVMALSCGIHDVRAAVLLSEPFNQSGTMAAGGYSAWSSVSGTGTQLAVSAQNGLEFGPSDRDYTRTFTSQSGSVFFGIDVAPQLLPTSGSDYFLALNNGGSFVGRFFLTSANSGAGYTLGLSVGAGTASISTSPAFSLTSQRIVGSYNAATGGIALWAGSFNPASPSISTTGTTTASINGFSIRQAGAFDLGASSIYLTNLIVSDDFASAVAVPEPAALVFAGLGLSVACASLRRRIHRG